MREYTEFIDFYNICISITENYKISCIDLPNSEKIKYIRKHLDKNILNCYFKIGNISYKTANIIKSKTTFLKFSVDNMVKNLIEHPEITINEYNNINIYLKNAEYILKKNNKNLIYFKINDKIYQFVIKSTKSCDELFITTFHKASIKQLRKDICRYISIKKDSLDCEDSKYPSVT